MNQYVRMEDQCIVVTPSVWSMSVTNTCKLINSVALSNNATKTQILFDHGTEGFQKEIIHHINDVVKCLVNEYGYDLGQFCYHSGTLAIPTNVVLYNSLPFDFLPRHLWLGYYIPEAFSNTTIDRPVNISVKPKKFLSMNGVPRTNRRLVTSWLLNNGLINDSYYSLDIRFRGAYAGHPLLRKYDKVTTDITKSITKPMMLSKNFNIKDTQPGVTDRIKEEDIYYFDNSYFSLVQETFYDDTLDNSTSDIAFYHSILVSEKTYRPIYFKHPFIMIGVHGTLAALREFGYKTFSPYFDESYDTIADPVLRLTAALSEVERLCRLPDSEWLTIQQELLPIVEYNYNVLTTNSLRSIKEKIQ
jgi:hypothetical protein